MRLHKIILMSFLAVSSFAFAKTEIISSRGDVQFRRGMEERWQAAQAGIELDEIDTIITMEGWVKLQISDDTTFELGPNSILDIGDLRLITRKEMFLFLMNEKIDKVKNRKQSSSLQMGNVATVHGLQANTSAKTSKANPNWQSEANAARAMYEQNFYTNAVVKFSKIFSKYDEIDDCGEINFYLGKALEALDETGQAIDQYQLAVDRACNTENDMTQEARRRVKKLSR